MNSIAKRNAFLPRVFQGRWDADLFDGDTGAGLPGMPAMNVVEKEGWFAVDLAVPGLRREDLDIEVDRSYLRISAKSGGQSEEKDADDRIIRQEFYSSSFERGFALPENIDTGHITAELENGILKLALPKLKNAPEDKRTKIIVR